VSPGRWLHGAARPEARLRLVLLPHGGGSAAAFAGWSAAAPPGLEVRPVQYPGRGERLDEPPLRSVPALAAGVAGALAADDRPLLLLGHSLGGLVALEAARLLVAAGAPPVAHLVVSGCAAPELPRTVPRPGLPDAALVDWLRELGGTDPTLLADPALLELLLPALRADLEMTARYRPGPARPLPCPVTALSGAGDRPEQAAGWRRYTDRGFTQHVLPGDHFFLYRSRERVLDLLLPADLPAGA